MKKLSLSLILIAFISLDEAMCQWNSNGNHIYNTNSGFVGIGTDTPLGLLYVMKNAGEPMITIRNTGGGGGATYSMIDDASGGDWKFKATTYGGFKIRDHANGLDVIVIEQNSAANSIYIANGGNLGIGTSNPIFPLDVHGNIRSYTAQLQITNDFAQADFQGSYIGWQLGAGKGYTRFVNNKGTGGDQAFRFQSTTDGVNFTDIMQLTASGKVGIGTINPVEKFEIQTDGLLRVSQSGNIFGERFGGPVLTLRNTDISEWTTPMITFERGDGSGTHAYIDTHENDANGIDKVGFSIGENNTCLYLLSNGNVGVNTTTPQSKLTVTGGDVNILDMGSGIIMKSPNGQCWRVTIDNSGNLVRTSITCP